MNRRTIASSLAGIVAVALTAFLPAHAWEPTKTVEFVDENERQPQPHASGRAGFERGINRRPGDWSVSVSLEGGERCGERAAAGRTRPSSNQSPERSQMSGR